MEHKTLADLHASGAILPESVVASIFANFSAEDKLMMGFKPKPFDGEKASEGWTDITTTTIIDESSYFPEPDALVWWPEKKTNSLASWSLDIESKELIDKHMKAMADHTSKKMDLFAATYIDFKVEGQMTNYFHDMSGFGKSWSQHYAKQITEEQIKMDARRDLAPVERARFRPFTSRDHSSLRSMKQAMFDRIVEGTRLQKVPAVTRLENGTCGPAYRNRAGAMCAIGLLIEPGVSVAEGKMANDPAVIRAIGTNEMMSDFLMSAQRRLHDAISTATDFMVAFEMAAESFASDHGLALVPA